jgi:DNA invertase Pin-like site-specific DNA recombinase
MQIPTKNAIILARVSTNQQAGPNNVSLESQLFDCMNYARTNNYNIVSTYTEVGSAYKYRANSKLEQLTSEIEKSNNAQKIDKLIFYSIDRFSRNALLGLSYLDRLKKFGITVESVTEPINQDSPFGRYQTTMLLSNGQLYSEMLGATSKKAKEYKKSTQNNVGRAGFGYVLQVCDNKRVLVPDENEQQIIKLIIGLREGTMTSAEATEIIYKYIDMNNWMPIEFYDGDTKIQKLSPYKITYTDIANLLNEYEVFRRGHKWTTTTISAICKKFGTLDITSDLDLITQKLDRTHIDSLQVSRDKLNNKSVIGKETQVGNGDIIIGKVLPLQPIENNFEADIMKLNNKRLKNHNSFKNHLEREEENEDMDEEDESIFDSDGKIKDMDSDFVTNYESDDELDEMPFKKQRFNTMPC